MAKVTSSSTRQSIKLTDRDGTWREICLSAGTVCLRSGMSVEGIILDVIKDGKTCCTVLTDVEAARLAEILIRVVKERMGG